MTVHFPAVNGRSFSGNGFFVSACLNKVGGATAVSLRGERPFCFPRNKAAGRGYLASQGALRGWYGIAHAARRTAQSGAVYRKGGACLNHPEVGGVLRLFQLTNA
jgi:hypothetical protein